MDLKSTIVNKILNMNKRKLGVIVIVVFVSILILFPFIDTNFFYANRIKNRIDILQKITELDIDKISQNQNLMKEYDSIVKEINESDSNYINKILSNNKNDHIIGKFISGGMLWWLLKKKIKKVEIGEQELVDLYYVQLLEDLLDFFALLFRQYLIYG